MPETKTLQMTSTALIPCVAYQFGATQRLEDAFFLSFEQQNLLRLVLWTDQERLLKWASDKIEIRLSTWQEVCFALEIAPVLTAKGISFLGYEHRHLFWKLIGKPIGPEDLWGYCDSDIIWGDTTILQEAIDFLKPNSLLCFTKTPAEALIISRGTPGIRLRGSKFQVWPDLKRTGALEEYLYPWYPDQLGAKEGPHQYKRTKEGKLYALKDGEILQEVFAVHLMKWKHGMAQLWEVQEGEGGGLPELSIQKGFIIEQRADDLPS